MFGNSSQTHGWHDGEQSHSPASFLEDHVSDCGISYAHMSPLLYWSPPKGRTVSLLFSFYHARGELRTGG